MPARTRYAALLAATIIGVIPAAKAQNGANQNPSAQQIINALKPTGPLSNTTRGIRPLPPGPGQAPATEAPSTTSKIKPGTAIQATSPAMPNPGVASAHGTVIHREAAPSVNLNVDFASNSAQLTPEATQTLDQLGSALTSKTLAQYRFKIVGHTDTVGNAGANKTLSDARAKAVAAYLENKFNVSIDRLDAVGVGEAGLLEPTPPQTPNARNRRVQVINLGH